MGVMETDHLPNSVALLCPLKTVGPVFWGAGNILHLDLGNGYTGVYIHKNVSSCTRVVPQFFLNVGFYNWKRKMVNKVKPWLWACPLIPIEIPRNLPCTGH